MFYTYLVITKWPDKERAMLQMFDAQMLRDKAQAQIIDSELERCSKELESAMGHHTPCKKPRLPRPKTNLQKSEVIQYMRTMKVKDVQAVARQFNVSKSTIYRLIKERSDTDEQLPADK